MSIRGGSIRGRMAAALVLVVLIALGVLAVGMAVMLRAERDFRNLADDRIPAVALAGELAEATGQLAMLAMRLAANPALPEVEMKAAVERASLGVEAVLTSDVLETAPERAATRSVIEGASRDLRRALIRFSQIGTHLTERAKADAQTEIDLRWLHSDTQDQVVGLLSDLSLNMDAQLAVLVSDATSVRRQSAENALSQDWLLRDRVQLIGSEAATLTAQLLQARAADSLDALAQIKTLTQDTLDRLALARLNLPPRSDISLLMDSVDDLTALAAGAESVFDKQQHLLEQRSAAVAELSTAQTALVAMQTSLTSLGRTERVAAQTGADAAATSILWQSLWLGVVTFLGAVATVLILAFFVHKRIILRIEALSHDLLRIARGDLAAPSAPLQGSDEIADMGRAVQVFRASVLERQQAMERLEQTQRELVQAGKMAALGQMSAAISHEINQPLAAISHRLHNLAASVPDARPAVSRIEALLDRITHTIKHLRRIARRSAHRNAKVMLAEPVQAALDLVGHRLRDENVGIVVADLNDVAISGDDILLEQVTLNILTNALDAIAAREDATQPGLIQIDLGDGDLVRLTIRDNGVGLGGQSGLRLFDPFYTTKEPDKGLGLGLSIAFNVMQDMGGHLDIQAHPQQGAIVVLDLKRWQGGQDA